MKTSRVFAVIFAVTVVAACLGACSEQNYKKIKPLAEYKIVHSDFVPESEEDTIKSSDLVFKGIVLDISEYEVKNTSDSTYALPVGLIKYKITDVIYSVDDNIQKGGEVYVLTFCTSHFWDQGAIKQELNNEYIILARIINPKQEGDPYSHFFTITKYCISNPLDDIITITDEGVKFDQKFSTLAQKASPSTQITYNNYTSDCYVMNEQEFIAELKKLIELYKTPQAGSTPEATR